MNGYRQFTRETISYIDITGEAMGEVSVIHFDAGEISIAERQLSTKVQLGNIQYFR